MTDIVKIQQEIKSELGKKEVMNALVSTTFKGLAIPQVYMALQEGMMRGFTFKDFLEKNIYAIPFGKTYSLITSIDYARKIAARSGLAGKSEPRYTFLADGQPETCTVTVRRNVDGYIGEYTATVYFDEYTTKRNLWATKPKMMIAKVAEMHALRAGFPEEMAKQYIEEEMHSEKREVVIDLSSYQAKLETVKTLNELKTVWAELPVQAKTELEPLKNELKTKLGKESTNENA